MISRLFAARRRLAVARVRARAPTSRWRGRLLHPAVVAEHAGEIITERQGGGEMDGVKRPQLNRGERRSGRAGVIVQWNLGKRGENSENRGLIRNHRGRVGSRTSDRTGELDTVRTLVARSLQRRSSSSSTSLSASRITRLTSADVST